MSNYVAALEEQEPQERIQPTFVPGIGQKPLVSSAAVTTDSGPTKAQHPTENDSGVAPDQSVPVSEPPSETFDFVTEPLYNKPHLLQIRSQEGGNNGQETTPSKKDISPLDIIERAFKELPELEAKMKQLTKEKKESEEIYLERIRELENKEHTNQRELQDLRQRTADLEKTLEEERNENAELRNENTELKQELEKMADEKEKEIMKIENELLRTKLELETKDNSFKEELRKTERERDEMKVKLAKKEKEEAEQNQKKEEQKRREVEEMNRILLDKIRQLEGSKK